LSSLGQIRMPMPDRSATQGRDQRDVHRIDPFALQAVWVSMQQHARRDRSGRLAHAVHGRYPGRSGAPPRAVPRCPGVGEARSGSWEA